MTRKKAQKRNIQKTAGRKMTNGFQTADVHVNRQFKDTLFRMLFNNREALLSLYNAINCSDYKDPEELEITTINDVIYMGVKNDVSFLIGSDMNLYEAQSTRNPNMPLRGLIYLAHLYEGYVNKNKLNLYGTRMISLPTPRYIVLYSGTQKEPDYREYYLTDSFAHKESACLECTAIVLNVNTGHNPKVLAQCRLLYEYASFLETVRNYAKSPSYTMEQAIDLAVTDCISKNILSDFLAKHRAEVMNVLLTEYDEDLHMKATYEEGRQEGLTVGIQVLILSNRRHNISKETTLHDLILNFSLSRQQAEEYMDQYW